MESVRQTTTPILTREDLNYITYTLDPIFTRFNNENSLGWQYSLEERTFGNAVAFKDKNRPTSTYYNRVIGLSEQDVGHLEDILNWFKESNLHLTISLPPQLQSPKLITALQQTGFKLDKPDCLYAAIPDEQQNADFAKVEKITKDNLGILFKIMEKSGTKIGPEQAEKVSRICVSPQFHFYVVVIDGLTVARASIFFHEKTAWLSNALTLQEYRGHGCQSMLLKARLNAAFFAGCKLALTDTDFGTTSHRNILRSGFHLCYMTAEFVR